MRFVALRLAELLRKQTETSLSKTSPGEPDSIVTIKDISPEVRRLSEYPIRAGGYGDLYLGERHANEKVALKLIRHFGSTNKENERAREVCFGPLSLLAMDPN